MSGRFRNRVCLITGSTGIGAATARLAVSEGASVFVVSRDEENCRALAEEIGCGYHVADLTRSGEVADAVERCIARLNRIDALFNVAGISGRSFGDGPVHECSEDGWNITMETNVKSVFLMCRAVVRRMLEQPVGESGLRGSILNMASVLVFSPEPKFFATHAYAAGKSAIVGLTRAMAAYYAPSKIRVNAVAPGVIRTDMSRELRHLVGDDLVTHIPQRRIGEPDEVARAVRFLASDEASYITGTVLHVDGGLCA